MSNTAPLPTLLALPAELLQHVLILLEPRDLASVAQTCHALLVHSYDDQIWQPLVNRNLRYPITAPAPLRSFRELYIAHHPHWFILRHPLWFSDANPHGKLVISRYDAQRGCILAYAVAAERLNHVLQWWEKDPEVVIHGFNPRPSLDLDKPVVKLDVGSPRTNNLPNNEPSDRDYAPPSVYSKETIMETTDTAGVHSSLMLCRALPKVAIGEQTEVWPPHLFQSESRVRSRSGNGFQSSGHRPTRYEEVSQHHFRVRKWVEYHHRRPTSAANMTTSPHAYAAALGINEGPYFDGHRTSSSNGGMSILMNEEVQTFATLPESIYTATPDKPWQGLWCGDYSGHGVEWLIITQPDKKDERPLPPGMDWLRQWFRGGRRGSSSSQSSYASAQEEIYYDEAIRQQVYTDPGPSTESPIKPSAVLSGFTDLPHPRTVEETTDNFDAPSGRLEAIKLTGDPNIPRGQYTFIAPDIGHGGLLRIADEETFRGARIVRSAGHIAGRGFQEDQYTPSQLIMISHDRVAQFWEGFGHISYYQRVDVDALMKLAV